MKIICSDEDCDYAVTISDPYSSKAKSLNTRSVLAMRSIGRGHSSMSKFCGVMVMLSPLSKPCFSQHNHAIALASEEAAKNEMLSASAYLHALHGSAPTEIIDVAVTCDGTWSKRGFTATYGVVLVVSWETGMVLDYEILSKRCNTCERQKTRWREDSNQFKEWMEVHKDNCAINHKGSSPAMECEGVLRIWSPSVEKRHLRYTLMVTARSLATLNEHKPDVEVKKHECVGHVQKRVTPRLKQARTLFNRDKAEAKKKVKELKEKMKKVREQYKLGSGRGRMVGETLGKRQGEGERQKREGENGSRRRRRREKIENNAGRAGQNQGTTRSDS